MLRAEGPTAWLLFGLAGIGVATGVVMFRVDWDRYPASRLLVVVPIALLCLGGNNALNPDPFMGGVQYPCLAIWIGISQRPGVAALSAPLLAVAYATPLAVVDPRPELWSAAVAMAVSCAFAGEPVAFLAGRLRSMSEAQRRSQERRFEAMLGQSSDFTLLLDAQLRERFVSRGVERMLGTGPDRGSILRDRLLRDRLHREDRAAAHAALAELAAEPGGTRTFRARMLRGDGTWAETEAAGRNLLDDPDVGGLLLAVRDVSDRVELERELERRATHDELTGLCNRRGLYERLAAVGDADERVAFLYCDLDNFKDINDELGHRVGDRVLIEVAARLSSAVPHPHTIARLGGDEFGVLLIGADEALARRQAREIVDAIGHPLPLDDRTIVPAMSVGVAASSTMRGRPALDDLLADADLAMYSAKTERAEGGVRAFDPRLRSALVERTQLHRELRSGLRNGEITVHYQPIICLLTGHVVGLEALARWHHPVRGLLPPGLFIGLAERTGLVAELNDIVMATACADLADLRRRDPRFAEVYVAVNTTAVQYGDDMLIERAGAHVTANDLRPLDLCLELTESEPLTGDDAMERVARLRRVGFRLAIDDFGTGYSSLRYLHELAVHVVKIDKGFTDGVVDGGTRSLIRSIVEISRGLGMTTIAEGVELPEQARILRELGVVHAQGYLYARPAPVEAIVDVVTGLAGGPARATGPDPVRSVLQPSATGVDERL
ncbi:MAG: EAL domain-containing protein [Actinomycetota bacterium]|nr:EAL domain-containing protein [Actinomycetota bacterium]